jgi:hypothetical protein
VHVEIDPVPKGLDGGDDPGRKCVFRRFRPQSRSNSSGTGGRSGRDRRGDDD